MQSSAEQLFTRRPVDYVKWALREATSSRIAEAEKLYETIFSASVETLTSAGMANPFVGAANDGALLRAKCALVASRLVAGSRALILDEPGTGLGRSVALAFVRATVSAADERSTPVILISHNPTWYSAVVRSRLELRMASEAPGLHAVRELVLERAAA